MSSYWNTENVVQIGESQVSVPCDLGQSFTVSSVSRKVSFEIPRSIEFISGKDCYLEFDVKINTPGEGVAGEGGAGLTRLQWDPAGAGMMVQNIRIYDESRGTLIEEVNEYNQVLALKYDYDTDNSLRNARQLEEGATVHNTFNEGTRGNSKSEMADTATNPWFKCADDSVQGPARFDPAVQNNTVKACVPLYCGVFQGHIFPNMLTGMYVELDLAPAPRMVHQLDSVVRDRRRTLNPVVFTFLQADGTATAPLPAGGGTAVVAVLLNLAANNQSSIKACPFVCGEKINFCSITDVTEADANIGAATTAVYKPAIISTISIDAANGNRIKLTFAEPMENLAAGDGRGADITNRSCVFSVSVAEATAYAPTYTVSNLDLVLHQVEMDSRYKEGMLAKAREGSAIEFDIRSMTNYKNSITGSEVQTTFLIHAQNHKAKSIVIIPTDSTVYSNQSRISSSGNKAGVGRPYEVTRDSMDSILCSARSGIAGINDYLTSYQFQMNGKLVPSRPVSTRKIATRKSIDAFPLFELDKGLDNAGITPKSYVKFMDNFVISRGFAVNSGCLDLRGQDLSVILDYGESLPATTPERKNKMYNTFVFHLRRVRIRGGMVEIIQ